MSAGYPHSRVRWGGAHVTPSSVGVGHPLVVVTGRPEQHPEHRHQPAVGHAGQRRLLEVDDRGRVEGHRPPVLPVVPAVVGAQQEAARRLPVDPAAEQVAVGAEGSLQGHEQPAVGELHHMAGPGAPGQAARGARVRDRVGVDRERSGPAVAVVFRLVHRVAGLAGRGVVHGLLIDATADGLGGGGEAADAGVHDDGAVADLGEGAVPVAGVLGVVLDHHPGAGIPAPGAVGGLDQARPTGVGVHRAPLLVVAQQQVAVLELHDAALVAASVGVEVGVDYFGVHSAHVLVPL